MSTMQISVNLGIGVGGAVNMWMPVYEKDENGELALHTAFTATTEPQQVSAIIFALANGLQSVGCDYVEINLTNARDTKRWATEIKAKAHLLGNERITIIGAEEAETQ